MRNLVSIFFCCAVMTGCAATQPRVDLVETKIVSLRVEKPESIHVDSSVYEQGGDLVIQGMLSRGLITVGGFPGHIDVTVTDPTGEETAVVNVRLKRGPGRRRYRYGKTAFKVELPEVPPPGSVVTIKYHEGEHQNG